MSKVMKDICHIESGGFAFGVSSGYLKTANRAIITHDVDVIKIKMDNRGFSPVRGRNRQGGFMVGTRDDARSTGRIGRYYRFTAKNGCIYIDLKEEVMQ